MFLASLRSVSYILIGIELIAEILLPDNYSEGQHGRVIERKRGHYENAAARGATPVAAKKGNKVNTFLM
jgi:hypothetical protein